ncbi:MAG: SCO family protein [Hyphomicrobiales bacterium]
MIAVLLAGTFAYVASRHRSAPTGLSSIRVSGLPASISTPLANQMQLSPIPARPAPDFTLTDQNGRTLTLKSFKGRAVVLEFMDPHCVDICPIVSQEYVDANRDLGKAASHVVFVAVNVNRFFNKVSDVARFSSDHQLDSIPTWHFFTGSESDLKSVWHHYNLVVQDPNPNADIIHTSVVYFIDPSGRERYLATPQDDHTVGGKAFLPANQIASWGRGIALVTQSLSH